MLQLQALIRRTARGDRDAFSQLYNLAAPHLFAIALRITGSPEEAEEVLQEAFVTAWQRAADYDAGLGAPMAWLITIVRRRAIDQVRRRAARQESRAGFEEIIRQLLSADRTERDAEFAAMQRCLSELDEQPRRAVLLAYLYGLSHNEIAAELAAPLGTVKSWIRRSLQKLKACLDP